MLGVATLHTAPSYKKIRMRSARIKEEARPYKKEVPASRMEAKERPSAEAWSNAASLARLGRDEPISTPSVTQSGC